MVKYDAYEILEVKKMCGVQICGMMNIEGACGEL
jgi:hypothetical protein